MAWNSYYASFSFSPYIGPRGSRYGGHPEDYDPRIAEQMEEQIDEEELDESEEE